MPLNLSTLKINNTPQGNTPTPKKKLDLSTLKKPQSFGGAMMSSAKNIAGGVGSFAKAIGTGIEDIGIGVAKSAAGLVNDVQDIGYGVTNTLGLTKPKENQPIFSESMTKPKGIMQNIGKFAGDVAPYLTGVGEEKAAATGIKTATKVAETLGKEATDIVPKAAGWLAKHSITGGINTLIGTVQAGGDLVKGAENAIIGEIAGSGLKKVTGYIANRAARTTKGIIDAITPKLTGNDYKEAAGLGHISAPDFEKGGGEDGTKMPYVTKAVTAISDMAKSLGKKTTDIIKTGSAQVTKNLERVGKTIGEYSEKVVKPLLAKNPVPFNFEDFRNAMSLIRPDASFKAGSAEGKVFNDIKERMIGIMANTLRKSGKTDPMMNFDEFWNGRILIDKLGKEEISNKIFNSPEYMGAKGAFQNMRQGVAQYIKDSFRYAGQMDKVNKMNDFIQTSIKRGINITEDMMPALKQQFGIVEDKAKAALADEWDKHMDNMHSAFDAIENLKSKVGTEKGKTVYELWLKSHPVLREAAKIGLGVGVVEYLKSKL